MYSKFPSNFASENQASFLQAIYMKDKIIAKATEMFMKLGFKSVTMEDIAGEMCISKKTIYKFFINKEVLIEEGVATVNKTVVETFEYVIAQNYNPIQENYEIKKMFKGIFQSAETSPLYQLKKHYPEIYEKIVMREYEVCFEYLRQNIIKGIAQGYYRADIDAEIYSRLYYMLTFSINENIKLEAEARVLESEALEYHTRAMATEKGLKELEFQLSNNN